MERLWATDSFVDENTLTVNVNRLRKKLDKAAMLICSKALGHNRISVVADNYIRGL